MVGQGRFRVVGRELTWRRLKFMLLSAALIGFAGSSEVAKAGSTQYSYDAAGRLSGSADATTGGAHYSYDNNGNISAVSSNAATTLAATGFSPPSGAVGASVTIIGTDFASGTTVKFNGTSATPTTVSTTSLTVKVPTGATTGPISVVSSGTTVTTAASFVVTTTVAPAITSFSPATVAIGGTVTINGTNFDPNATNDKVFVNGQIATVASATATTLSVTVPLASSGPISVETSSGSATSTSKLIVAPPGYAASTIGSTTSPTSGTQSTVTIGSSGQIELVFFQATAGQRISTVISATTLGGGTAILYGPDDTNLASTGIGAGASLASVMPLTTGTYTLAFLPGGSPAPGSITFTG